MKIKNERDRLEDRRHDVDAPKTPINVDYGVAIVDDRRKTPDRRINSIEVEWVEEDEIS